jgi:acyl-CoA synthetase (AMP-forming)/AMP-acid ligase II
MPPAELRVFAGQSEPRLLFADEGFLEAARASIEPGCGVRTLSNPVLQASVESPLARATDRAAVIAYTSGTTGTPKGVVLTNGALLANAMNARAVFALSAGDHVLMALGRSFRTGDAGYIDEDGFLHIVERLKDIIIVGGSNVYPADIESVLVSDPRVREAAVVGRPDTECGEVPAAFVVGEPGLTHDHVRALFHGVLAEYKHPRDVFFVEQLPRSALGKVQRSVLRAWAQSERSGVARRDSSEPAATAQLV